MAVRHDPRKAPAITATTVAVEPDHALRDRLGVRLIGRHWPFAVLLVVGVALRLIVMAAFPPALVLPDTPAYLGFVTDHLPNTQRPLGYGILELWPLSWVTGRLVVVVAVQHLLGLVTAGVLYAILVRRGVRPVVATLAAVPVVLDSMQLLLEQMVYSDTLFVLLVVLSVAAVSWRRRPTVGYAALAGVLLGCAVTVRVVGEPLIVIWVGFCLVAAGAWRRRIATALVCAIGFAVPVGAYEAWFHHYEGVYAITQFSGRSLYMRTTTFVDCQQIDVPAYLRQVCPPQPVGHRLDPDEYGWSDPLTKRLFHPPPGTTQDQALRSFAVTAIKTQPFDYARTVARDFLANFDIERVDRFDYSRSNLWRFGFYRHRPIAPRIRAVYLSHGDGLPHVGQPFADGLVQYQRFGYLPGPLLGACLLLGLAGALGFGAARRSGLRAVCALYALGGTTLILVPVVAEEFIWRYQLPTLALLPAAAALAWTALRADRRPPP